MRLRLTVWGALLAAIGLVLAGCGGGGGGGAAGGGAGAAGGAAGGGAAGGGAGAGGASGGPTTTSSGSSSVIGASGGSLTAQTGAAAGASIVVPSGAVAAPLTITITDGSAVTLTGTTSVGPAAQFGPSGTTFVNPVTVTLPFSLTAVQAAQRALSEIVLLRREDASGALSALSPTSINASSGSVEAETSTFSTFQAVVGSAPDPGLSSVAVDRSSGVIADGVDAVHVTVEVRDVLNLPLAGASVAVQASGAGNVVTGPVLTNASGTAVITLASTHAEVKMITATVIFGSGPPVTVASQPAVQFRGGAASQLAFASQPGTTAAGAAILPGVAIAVEDAFGNLSDPAPDVAISLGANPGSAPLGGTTTATPSGGLALFTNLRVLRPGNGYTLVASASGVTSATSQAFDVQSLSAGFAAGLAFTTQPTTTTAFAILPPVAVSFVDTAGNVVTSALTTITISFAPFINSPTPSGTTTVTPTAGTAVFSDLSIDRTGTIHLFATATGFQRAISTYFDITAPAPPPAPAALMVVSATSTIANISEVDLAWSVAPTFHVIEERVERSPVGAGSFVEIAALPAGTTSYADTTPVTSTAYDYRVSNFNDGGESPSNVTSVATPAPPPPAAPQVHVDPGPGAVSVSWGRVEGALSYRVYRDTTSGIQLASPSASLVIQDAPFSPRLVTGVAGGVTEFFVVTAIGWGGESAPSAEVASTPSADVALPTPVTHEMTGPFGTIVDVAVDPLRLRAYLLDGSGDRLLALDEASESVLAAMPVTTGARAVSLSPNCQHLRVACATEGLNYFQSLGAQHGALALVDPDALTVTAEVVIPVEPWDLATVDDGYSYIPSGGGQWTEITIVDSSGARQDGWFTFERVFIAVAPQQTHVLTADTAIYPLTLTDFRLGTASTGVLGSAGVSIGVERARPCPSADGRHLITVRGELFALVELPYSGDLASETNFSEAPNVPVAAAAGSDFFGIDSTGRVSRFDVATHAVDHFAGYNVSTFGNPMIARLGRRGTALYVVTDQNRLIVVPVP